MSTGGVVGWKPRASTSANAEYFGSQPQDKHRPGTLSLLLSRIFPLGRLENDVLRASSVAAEGWWASGVQTIVVAAGELFGLS